MTCQGCEARRKWMKEQYERSKERMRLCIERLTPKVDRTKQPTHPDQQRAERTDQ